MWCQIKQYYIVQTLDNKSMYMLDSDQGLTITVPMLGSGFWDNRLCRALLPGLSGTS